MLSPVDTSTIFLTWYLTGHKSVNILTWWICFLLSAEDSYEKLQWYISYSNLVLGHKQKQVKSINRANSYNQS